MSKSNKNRNSTAALSTSDKSSDNRKEKEKVEERVLFADINVTMKSGHLTRDAEIVGDGKYVKLRFASNKQYEHEGTIKTNTNYFDAMISANLTDAFTMASAFKKGDWIYLKGQDSTRSFDTPEGYKKTANTIFAYHISLKKEKAQLETEPDKDNNKTPVPV